MKRIIFLFVFGIMSLVSFGQVDTLYLSKHNGSTSYHSTLECQKVHNIVGIIVVSKLTNMYQLNKYFRCYKCVSKDMISKFKEVISKNEYDKTFKTLGIQTYDSEQPQQINEISREYMLKVQVNEMYKAGLYQQKSARCHFIALGFGGAAGLTAAIPSMMSERDRKDMGTTGFYVASGILGAGALISEICAYTFQLNSGKSLKVAANHIQYNF